MYILLESSHGSIYDAYIESIDAMGVVTTEAEAMEWRNANLECRAYKYVRVPPEMLSCKTSAN